MKATNRQRFTLWLGLLVVVGGPLAAGLHVARTEPQTVHQSGGASCPGVDDSDLQAGEPNGKAPLSLGYPDGSARALDGSIRSQASGSAREVSSGDGSTVEIIDRLGADELVVTPPHGATLTYESKGELAFPATGAEGTLAVEQVGEQDTLIIFDTDLKATERIPAPEGTLDIAYPTWGRDGTVIAAIGEPIGFGNGTRVKGDPNQIAYLNEHFANQSNLWTYTTKSGEWARTTTFGSEATPDLDHWVTVNSPVVNSDGSISFVRLSGLGSGTEADLHYELWRSDGRQASLVGDLPPETYLAGSKPDGTLVASQFDLANSTWSTGTLVDGRYTPAACGAARMNALDVDPDLAPPPEAESAGDPSTTETTVEEPHIELRSAIFVSEFPSEAAALAFSPTLTGTWKVIAGADFPTVTADGTFALIRSDSVAEIGPDDTALWADQMARYTTNKTEAGAGYTVVIGAIQADRVPA
jgi:hypothetical protein